MDRTESSSDRCTEYYARPPATNDNHGLGAFLLMYDQLTCR